MSPIGRVVGTERKPNTPHEFHFWTAPESDVGIGTLVKVVIDGARALTVYGIVVDGASYSDLQTALAAEQSWRTTRSQLTAAQVQALRRSVQAYKALGGGWPAEQFSPQTQAR